METLRLISLVYNPNCDLDLQLPPAPEPQPQPPIPVSVLQELLSLPEDNTAVVAPSRRRRTLSFVQLINLIST